MPKGITHETPPNLCRLQMTQVSPRHFRGRDTLVQLSCAVHPLIERLPVFRQDTVELYHIPLEAYKPPSNYTHGGRKV